MRVVIADIVREPALQVRPIDETVVARYAAALAEGATFPPINVVKVQGRLLLVNGWHRVAAHERAGATEIAAAVMDGTMASAIVAAATADSHEGLPRSTSDKRRAVEMVLTNPEAAVDPETGAPWSDRRIAAMCGVSNTTVANVRNAISAAIKNNAMVVGVNQVDTYNHKSPDMSSVATKQSGKTVVQVKRKLSPKQKAYNERRRAEAIIRKMPADVRREIEHPVKNPLDTSGIPPNVTKACALASIDRRFVEGLSTEEAMKKIEQIDADRQAGKFEVYTPPPKDPDAKPTFSTIDIAHRQRILDALKAVILERLSPKDKAVLRDSYVFDHDHLGDLLDSTIADALGVEKIKRLDRFLTSNDYAAAAEHFEHGSERRRVCEALVDLVGQSEADICAAIGVDRGVVTTVRQKVFALKRNAIGGKTDA